MKKIIIADNDEPMVQIKRFCPHVVVRQYEKGGGARQSALKVRKTVAKMLNRAQSYLPEDINLMVRDAWRPVAVQRQLFLNMLKNFRRQYPNWTEKKVYSIASKYAIPPDAKITSGHLTGGAVDVTLCRNNKKRLPMKMKKLSYREQAATASIRKLPASIVRNRQILLAVMTKAGFSNLPTEWWHFSFGDYWWAKRTGASRRSIIKFKIEL